MTKSEINKAVKDTHGWTKTIPFNDPELTTYTHDKTNIRFFANSYPVIRTGSGYSVNILSLGGFLKWITFYDYFTCRRIRKAADKRFEHNRVIDSTIRITNKYI